MNSPKPLCFQSSLASHTNFRVYEFSLVASYNNIIIINFRLGSDLSQPKSLGEFMHFTLCTLPILAPFYRHVPRFSSLRRRKSYSESSIRFLTLVILYFFFSGKTV